MMKGENSPKGESPMSPLLETAPKLELKASELESELLPELQAYHEIYNPLFRRREQREESRKYLKGLLSELENKSVESMVLHFEGDNPNAIRSAQQFLGKGAWSDGPILQRHWQEVTQDLGEKKGVLIVDGSDFPKQGEGSVGVKRQMCGELGKVANCQAGVFLSYASAKGYTLLDRRLYLPEEWVEAQAYSERRKKCGVPLNITFQTKPQLAAEMVLAVYEAKNLPFRWLTCDEAFGRDTQFLDTVGEVVSYFAEVPCDTRIWQNRPATEIPQWSGRGRPPTRHQLVEGEPDALPVDSVAQALPSTAWRRLRIKEGTKGPLVADFACQRVVAVRDALPGPDVWLIFRRNPSTGEIKYYLSNAPLYTSIQTFAWLSGMRWPIETCFEDSKQELGMGDYQVRSWTGWHHHMTLVILAHFFLVRLKLRLRHKAPALTLPQTVLLLQSILPKPVLDAQLAIDIVQYRQRRNHDAYISHRKARLRILAPPSEVSL
jgi:SRSO17 transposase